MKYFKIINRFLFFVRLLTKHYILHPPLIFNICLLSPFFSFLPVDKSFFNVRKSFTQILRVLTAPQTLGLLPDGPEVY